MSSIALSRISTEIKELMSNTEDNTYRIIPSDDLTQLKAEIAGPPDTPYEGGTFLLDIKIPINYPFKPPLVKFITKVWHPNILSATGLICLDILSNQWAATMTLRTVFLSIQALLSTPEPTDPQDPGVASQYLDNPEIYKQTAQHWTNAYAGGPHSNEEFNNKITSLLEIGVDEEKAREVLSFNNWSVEQATDVIFRDDAPRTSNHIMSSFGEVQRVQEPPASSRMSRMRSVQRALNADEPSGMRRLLGTRSATGLGVNHERLAQSTALRNTTVTERIRRVRHRRQPIIQPGIIVNTMVSGRIQRVRRPYPRHQPIPLMHQRTLGSTLPTLPTEGIGRARRRPYIRHHQQQLVDSEGNRHIRRIDETTWTHDRCVDESTWMSDS